MRGTRELVGSLGAGLSLAIAASAALLVVSTVVAFRGWPDDLRSSGESVSKLAPAAPIDDKRALPPVVAAELTIPAATVAPRVQRAAGTRPTRGGSDGGPTSPGGTSTPSVTPSSPVPGAPPAAAGGDQVGETVKHTGTATGDTVRETTHQTATTVQPVAPAASGVVEDVGNAAGDVVDQGGNAVAEALGHVGQ